MKTKHFFLVLVVILLGSIITANAQATQSTNTITPGSYLGTSNNEDVEFKMDNTFSGELSKYNTFFGYDSGDPNGSNNYFSNSAFGENALQAIDPSIVIKYNSAFGDSALKNNLGSHNSAFGVAAMQQNISGTHNTALGFQAMASGSTGWRNIGIGIETLRYNSGDNNIGFGYQALFGNNGSGDGNIGIGVRSLHRNSGSYNVAIGESTGDLNTGWKNTFIGYKAGGSTSASTGNHNVMIGSNIFFTNALSNPTMAGSDTSNSIVIGSSGQHRILIDDNGYTAIGLPNNALAQNRLELGSGISGTSGLRFRSIDSSSPTVTPNGVVLTVDVNGDVVLTTDQTGGSGGSNDNIYTVDGTLAGNRTVLMDDNRLMFNTATNGAIYVGNTTTVNDNANFPTTTGNYKLYVEGGILTEKVKVALRTSANWADYVFKDDYNLMPLNDVETYIKTNKHLPGIDSAENLVENGLDLADMQAKQMEKIEELTLYVIDQDKKVKQQSKEIDELKAMVKALLERE